MNKIDAIMRHSLYDSCMDKINKAEQNRIFCRHGIEHSLDVARIGYIISMEEKLGIDKELIYAAALLHDIGRCEEYAGNALHDKAGTEIAGHILADSGFSDCDIDIICDAIEHHRAQTNEADRALRQLLYRADKLSRNCFACKASGECYWSEKRKNSRVII